ncbi:carbon-nitrogen hydrolase family protein [bacterium SCSIO 12696]|nr:carbon-nitrogen hydrolase family protein [bacterium SCSIO 12696]
MTQSNELTVALGQIAPVWLDRDRTIDKILAAISEAADKGAQLIAFGEALLPGYPFWLERTGGAEFNSARQKHIHAHYLRQAVDIDAGHLEPVCTLAQQKSIAVVLGVAERPRDRGSHSLYCSLVYIDSNGTVKNVHRKLMPTYEERLTWSPGDGHGLQTYPLGPFTLGALNCWENWMPLPRASLYAQGENLHVAIWPGGDHNTRDITRFIAQEGRSFVLSASSLMRLQDLPEETPYRDEIAGSDTQLLANGGSCLAAPDGSWVIEPQVGGEGVYLATIDHNRVLEERQNFDPAGHYSRPDVTQLTVNRQRQGTVTFEDT